MGTEIKADAWYRYMLYRKNEYVRDIFPTREQKLAIEAGKQYTLAAYPDVWAENPDIVKRIRRFLSDNFHWHDLLAQRGTDLEVVETLFSMVRGGSIVVIPEQSVRIGGASHRAPPPAPKRTFLDMATEKMGLSYEAALKYVNDYNDIVDRYYAIMEQRKPASVPARDSAAGYLPATSTPLGDAQPFVYSEDRESGGAFDIAKTPNKGKPGSWYTNPGSGQMRLYGNDCNPVVDLDFDHIHNGLCPHAHNWGPAGRDTGTNVVPFSPWRP